MVKIEKIKEFLHIDTDTEDVLLNQYARTAEDYLKSSCGKRVNLDDSRAELVQLMLIADWHETRTLYAQGTYSRAVDSMIMQLKLETEV